MNKFYIKSEKLEVNDKEQIISGVIGSTGIIDRHGESVNPMGWQLENYKKSPVVLYGHDYSSFPIGKALKVWIEDNKLKFTIEFAKTEEGVKVYELIKGGFLNTSSVGFIPKKFGVSGQDDYTIMEQELLELSIVPVPANPEALIINSIEKDTVLEKIKFLAKMLEAKELEHKAELEKQEIEKKQKEEEAKLKAEADEKFAKEVESRGLIVLSKELYEEMEKQVDELKTIKAGRILSENNRKLINTAVTQMSETITALKDLLKATEEKKKAEIKEDEKNLLEEFRNYLKRQNLKTSLKLKELNEILGKKRIKSYNFIRKEVK